MVSFDPVLWAFLLAVLAGLSTGIGALIAYFIKKPKFPHLSFLLGFAAGVMIFISFVELLRTSIEHVRFFKACFAFFVGIIVIYLIDLVVPHGHLDTEPDSFYESVKDSERLAEVGVLTAIGIAIHNLPEGMAVFATSLESPGLGIPIALAIGLHNIPEGIAVSIPIFYATGNKLKAFSYSFFSGITEPLGAAIGYLFFMPFLSKTVLNLILAFVAGIMVFISFDELLPVSREFGNEHLSSLGLFTGMFIMMLTLLVFQ